ncbi:uncharacterized protein LOC114863488 [Betta splendens]|uniref:Uncharacterized protein LOC114863488 n=1 Tax=Betta splendens TaxID=158456 RepID=A0A8M1HIK2_BETSP|nr:uncharacterized protein LOC114863488 [Betta splendens]
MVFQQDKHTLLELLEEHRQDMEELLVDQSLMSLSAVKELNQTLRASVETQRALADQVEGMKESGVFLSGLVQDLAGLHDVAVQGLTALQSEHDQLAEQIRRAQERHETGMKRTMDQINLLLLEAQKNYADLHTSATALQKPVQSTQHHLSSGLSTAKHQASTQADLLSSTFSYLSSSLRLNADESRQTLEEMAGSTSYLHSTVSVLVERESVSSAEKDGGREPDVENVISPPSTYSPPAQKNKTTRRKKTSVKDRAVRPARTKRSSD